VFWGGVVWEVRRVNRIDFGMCAAEELLECSSHLTVAVGLTELATCLLFGCQ
jgi:hypothetical protein